MTNKHLIGRQRMDIQIHSMERVQDIQHELSHFFWQKMKPALEKLFDQLASPEELIRIDRLEIDLGTIALEDLFSEVFIKAVLDQLSLSITQAADRSSSQATRQSIRQGHFELWLFFLQTGTLPIHSSRPESIPIWHRRIFDTLALEASAVERLSKTLRVQAQALKRLVLQHDASFKLQMIRLFTGYKHDDLPELLQTLGHQIAGLLYSMAQAVKQQQLKQGHKQEQIVDQIMERLQALFSTSALPQIWSASLKKWLLQHASFFANKTPAQLQQQFEQEAWRVALQEVMLERKKIDTAALLIQITQHPAMAHWQPMVIRELSRKPRTWRPIVSKVLLKEIKAGMVRLEPTKTALDRKAARPEKLLTEQQLDSGPPTENAEGNHPDNRIAAEQASAANPTESMVDLAPTIPERSPRNQSPDNAADLVPEVHPGNDFFVQNAGLVLLHYFLPRFFQRLELCENNRFKDPWSQQKAIHLLHYLCTGTTQEPEFQLILPKLLCGLPLNMPIEHQVALSQEELEEAENLLKAAIEHWGVLGSTSPDGLREGFLQREGRLEKRPAGWFLRIESKTLDVLLDRLPWGLSMIKLPWMEDLLRVEWR